MELGPSSVTKIPVIVKGDPKGCWILELGFPDMFGLSMSRIKCKMYSAVKHVINTRDACPVKQRPCRTPLVCEGEEKKTP